MQHTSPLLVEDRGAECLGDINGFVPRRRKWCRFADDPVNGSAAPLGSPPCTRLRCTNCTTSRVLYVRYIAEHRPQWQLVLYRRTAYCNRNYTTHILRFSMLRRGAVQHHNTDRITHSPDDRLLAGRHDCIQRSVEGDSAMIISPLA